jgi:hypothetical protein
MTTTRTEFLQEMEATPAEQVAEAQGLDEAEAFTLYCENCHADTLEKCEALVDEFHDAYIGEGTLADFAEEAFHMAFDVPRDLERYIDYKAYERDLEASGDIYELGNYLFRGV